MTAIPESDRPNISIVAGAPTASEPIAPSAEPEAQPPGPTIPPQEREPDMGAPRTGAPSEEEIQTGSGGSLADRMKARFNAMDSTEEFPVPGWDREDGEPGPILVAKTFGDRQGYQKGIANEVFIAKSTHKLLYVNDDGSREEIPGGWGPALAELIGVKAQKAADLIAYVISKPHPIHKNQRIPNVAGIGILSTQILEWSGKAHREAEENLGE